MSVKILSFILVGIFFINLCAIPLDADFQKTDDDSFRKNDSKLMTLSYILSGSTALVLSGLSLMLVPPAVLYLIGIVESSILSIGRKDYENILNIFKGSFAAVTTVCIIAAILTDFLVFF